MWIEAYGNWVHSLGLHLYTIPTIIVAIVAIVLGVVHWVKQKKRDKDFEASQNAPKENGMENPGVVG